VILNAVVEHLWKSRNPSAGYDNLIDMEGRERSALFVKYSLKVLIEGRPFIEIQFLASLIQL
jgi:hypothetical protein